MKTLAVLLLFSTFTHAAPKSWMRLDGEKLEAKNSTWPFGSVARRVLEELNAMSGPVNDNKFTIERTGREAPSWLNPLAAYWPVPCTLKIELYGVEEMIFLDLRLGDTHAVYSNDIPVEVLAMTNDSSGFSVTTLCRGLRREDETTLKIERRAGSEVLVHVRETSSTLPSVREKTCLFDIAR